MIFNTAAAEAKLRGLADDERDAFKAKCRKSAAASLDPRRGGPEGVVDSQAREDLHSSELRGEE
eukprot:1162062-Pelagomonas_calceolata.AAC.24